MIQRGELQNCPRSGNLAAIGNDEPQSFRFPSEVNGCDMAEVIAVELVGERFVTGDSCSSDIFSDLDIAPGHRAL